MSRFKNFLSFVEITTKLCSFVPFFIGIAYTLYQYGTGDFDLLYTFIFIIAMFFFDMSATAINNQIGAREAGTRTHYSYVGGWAIIVTFIAIATTLGVVLTAKYGLAVLGAGLICFFIGIFYSFSRISISHTPYGEIFSGLIQGFFITFIVTYINSAPDSLVGFEFYGEPFGFGHMVVDANIPGLIKLLLVTIPCMLCISGIMLANNTCDVEEDVKIKRYTLPYYMGTKNALKLFSILYHSAFIVIIFSVIVRVASPVCLLILLLYPKVRSNIKKFQAKQSKAETFSVSVANFMMICSSYAITLGIGAIIKMML